MSTRPPYSTEYRRRRERTHRSRFVLSLALAVALHVGLAVALAPFRRHIPLVRHLGYHGVLRILPEISVQRDPGTYESERETAVGAGSESFFRVVAIRTVDWAVPSGEPSEVSTGEARQEDAGEEVRTQLERSLPQPTSSDVVLVRFVKPFYPTPSIAANVEGVVVFRLHVTQVGEVARAWLLSSEVDEACEMEAQRAVMQWKFRPYLVEGEPTAILVDQRIRFRLHDAPVIPAQVRLHQ